MELQHKRRMESIDIKMDKIPYRSKGPSREVGSDERFLQMKIIMQICLSLIIV